MDVFTLIATVFIAVALVYQTARRARAERQRPERVGRPVRTWYLVVCTVIVVLAVVGMALVIVGQ